MPSSPTMNEMVAGAGVIGVAPSLWVWRYDATALEWAQSGGHQAVIDYLESKSPPWG